MINLLVAVEFLVQSQTYYSHTRKKSRDPTHQATNICDVFLISLYLFIFLVVIPPVFVQHQSSKINNDHTKLKKHPFPRERCCYAVIKINAMQNTLLGKLHNFPKTQILMIKRLMSETDSQQVLVFKNDAARK